MVLFDALYINSGGGKVLLDVFLDEISNQENNQSIMFLLDKRVEETYKNKYSSLNIIYLKATLFNRHRFYIKNKTSFLKVFCFGNLPPTLKLKVPVYTYLHQKYYIKIPDSLSVKEKFIFKIKTIVFKRLLPNTTFFLVQSELMKKQLSEKYKFMNVKVFPFFKENKSDSQVDKEKNNFLYVSLASSHKNHINLIHAFCLSYNKKDHSTLNLTVSNENPVVLKLIDEKNKDGFPIQNHGFVNQKQKKELYNKAEFVIFPSLTESLGLGLIEAMQFNCKIIASELDYVHEIVKPSLTFNPNDVEDISNKITFAIHNQLSNSKLIVQNKIIELIELLK